MPETLPETLDVASLLTNKAALGESRLETRPMPLALSPDEVVLQLDRVAITTNNITYAGLGDALGYWRYFPADTPGFGHMPVWGFAHVVASRAEGIDVGERFFGYYPIATHLKVQAGRVSARGFADVAPHRAGLLSVYNRYTRCGAEPAFSVENEAVQALTRPLFLTSFMTADFLRDHDFFGARQVVVSSASSKTAYGTAFCLGDEAGPGPPGVELIALTSTGNRAFVESLGCYGRTETYDTLAAIAPDVPTLYLDFAGSGDLRAAVHRHFGEQLRYDCLVGAAQSGQIDTDTGPDLPGPAPEVFFVAAQIEKRHRHWGVEGLAAHFEAAHQRFIARLRTPENPWMRVVESHGLKEAEILIAELAAGRIDPQAGHVVSLRAG